MLNFFIIGKTRIDNISAIFNIIKDCCKNASKECKFTDLEKRVLNILQKKFIFKNYLINKILIFL